MPAMRSIGQPQLFLGVADLLHDFANGIIAKPSEKGRADGISVTEGSSTNREASVIVSTLIHDHGRVAGAFAASALVMKRSGHAEFLERTPTIQVVAKQGTMAKRA